MKVYVNALQATSYYCGYLLVLFNNMSLYSLARLTLVPPRTCIPFLYKKDKQNPSHSRFSKCTRMHILQASR